MARASNPPSTQKSHHMSTRTKKAMSSQLVPIILTVAVQATNKATRHSHRIRTAIENSRCPSDTEEREGQIRQGAKARKRARDPEKHPRAQHLPQKRPWEEDTLTQKCTKRQKQRPSPDKLSERNLRAWDNMDAPTNNNRLGSIKRSSSQRSITSDASQRSSGSLAGYRFIHLANADVYVHVKMPKETREAADAIINSEPPNGRREQLKTVSQVFSDGCTEAARAAVGEDDFVRHFLTALQAIQPSNLCFREKADWEEDLKPTGAQSTFNLDLLTNVSLTGNHQEHETGLAAAPPSKRPAYMSPKSSKGESDMMPPPAHAPLLMKEFPIKPPRPDLLLGTKLDALIRTLSSPDLSSIEARKFLRQLQNQMIARGPCMILEPMLVSVPAPRASDLAFPFAVVEGKAYSTGRQIFEAENQAAVSGACALKIQLCLDDLVKRATASSDSQFTPLEEQPALFFSVCTQGPIHELWIHWTSVEDGVRKFNMTLLKSCHACLLDGVEDFIVAVDNLLRWGTGPFVDLVVERLRAVAKMAKV